MTSAKHPTQSFNYGFLKLFGQLECLSKNLRLRISCALLSFLVNVGLALTSNVDLGVIAIRGLDICRMVILSFCPRLFYLKCPFWIYMYVIEFVFLGPNKITICVF